MIFPRQILLTKSFASSTTPSLPLLEISSKVLSPQTLLKSSICPHIRSLNLLLSFLLTSRKFTLLLETFSQFALNSIRIDSKTHFLVTHALIGSRRYEEAKQFITSDEKYDFVVRKSLWDSLVREVCVSGEDPEGALSLLHECVRNRSTSFSIVTFRWLVFSFSSQGMMERSLEVLETMTSEKIGYPFDNFVCSSIICGFSRIGKPDLGLGLYERMQKYQSFQPNLMTYTAVVDSLCREGRVDEASNLVQQMESNGVILDAVLYTCWMCGVRKDLLMGGLWKHSLMSENEAVPDVVSYTALIDGLCKEGHLENGIGISKFLEMSGLKPNLFTFTAIIQGFCKRCMMDEAFLVFWKMEELNVAADEFVFSVLIYGLCSSRRLDKVFELLEEMDRKGIQATSMTYNTVVNGLCKAGRRSKVDEISKNYFGNNYTYNTLSHGYMKGEDGQGVIDSKRRLEQSGITLDVVTVNMLIKAFFVVGLVDDARSLFEEMPQKGICADFFTYCTMVNGYYKLGRSDRALEVFMHYKRTPAFVNDACHICMIEGLCKEEKIEMATELFLELCEKNIVSNAITFRNLMRDQFRTGKGEAVLNFLSSVEKCDPVILSSICNDAVSFLCQMDCFPSALETYILMRLKGLIFWSKSYYILLQGLINSENGLIFELILCDYMKACGVFEPRMVNIICLYLCKKNVEEAIRFLPGLNKGSISLGVLTVVVSTLKEGGRVQDALNFLLEAEENGSSADVVVYSIIVDGLCKVGSLEKAVDLCTNMRKRGIPPNIITYNSVIYGLCHEGCLLKAFRVFDSLEYNGLFPTIVTYATLVSALSREGFLQDAKQLLDRMSAEGISPNTFIFNSMINGYCRFGLLEEGMQLFKDLSGYSLEPDDFTISSLICGFCITGDMQGALNFYNEYRGKGISPDFLGFFDMIKGLFAKGRMEEARNIIRNMLQCRGVVDLINKAGDGLNFDSLANYINLISEEGRLQEVINILSIVGSKFFSSWWSRNSNNVGDGKQHVVGTFTRDAVRKIHATPMISRVPGDTLQSVEKCIKMDDYTLLSKNSCNYDFETYYSIIAALCLKGELQKANNIVNETILSLVEKD